MEMKLDQVLDHIQQEATSKGFFCDRGKDCIEVYGEVTAFNPMANRDITGEGRLLFRPEATVDDQWVVRETIVNSELRGLKLLQILNLPEIRVQDYSRPKRNKPFNEFFGAASEEDF